MVSPDHGFCLPWPLHDLALHWVALWLYISCGWVGCTQLRLLRRSVAASSSAASRHRPCVQALTLPPATPSVPWRAVSSSTASTPKKLQGSPGRATRDPRSPAEALVALMMRLRDGHQRASVTAGDVAAVLSVCATGDLSKQALSLYPLLRNESGVPDVSLAPERSVRLPADKRRSLLAAAVCLDDVAVWNALIGLMFQPFYANVVDRRNSHYAMRGLYRDMVLLYGVSPNRETMRMLLGCLPNVPRDLNVYVQEYWAKLVEIAVDSGGVNSVEFCVRCLRGVTSSVRGPSCTVVAPSGTPHVSLACVAVQRYVGACHPSVGLDGMVPPFAVPGLPRVVWSGSPVLTCCVYVWSWLARVQLTAVDKTLSKDAAMDPDVYCALLKFCAFGRLTARDVAKVWAAVNKRNVQVTLKLLGRRAVALATCVHYAPPSVPLEGT